MPALVAVTLACAALGLPSEGGVARLTETTLSQESPVWSPDGSAIATVETGEFGVSVGIVRASDGMSLAGGPGGGPIAGAPVWLDEGRTVAWLERRGVLWTLGLDGSLVTTSASRPASPLGLASWPGVGLLLWAEREVWLHPAEATSPPRSLPVVSADSSLRALVPLGREGLLLVDGGRLLVWDGSGRPREVPRPAEVAEYVDAVAWDAGSVLLVARSRDAALPNRVSRFEPARGTETPLVLAEGIVRAAAVPGSDLAVIETGEGLWRVDGDGGLTALSDGSALDRTPAVSPDGRMLVFASAGRDDTDGDGEASRADPTNLYAMWLD